METALLDANAAIAFAPDLATGYQLKGEALVYAGRYREGQDALERALARGHETADTQALMTLVRQGADNGETLELQPVVKL